MRNYWSLYLTRYLWYGSCYVCRCPYAKVLSGDAKANEVIEELQL